MRTPVSYIILKYYLKDLGRKLILDLEVITNKNEFFALLQYVLQSFARKQTP